MAGGFVLAKAVIEKSAPIGEKGGTENSPSGNFLLRRAPRRHQRGVDWTPALVVSSLELIETYVAEGYGIGATIAVPRVKVPAGLRHLSLPGFESVSIGAILAGEGSPLVLKLIAAFQQ